MKQCKWFTIRQLLVALVISFCLMLAVWTFALWYSGGWLDYRPGLVVLHLSHNAGLSLQWSEPGIVFGYGGVRIMSGQYGDIGKGLALPLHLKSLPHGRLFSLIICYIIIIKPANAVGFTISRLVDLHLLSIPAKGVAPKRSGWEIRQKHWGRGRLKVTCNRDGNVATWFRASRHLKHKSGE